MKPGWNYFIKLTPPDIQFFFCFAGCKVRVLQHVKRYKIKWQMQASSATCSCDYYSELFSSWSFFLGNFSNTAQINLTRKGSELPTSRIEREKKIVKIALQFYYPIGFSQANEIDNSLFINWRWFLCRIAVFYRHLIGHI